MNKENLLTDEECDQVRELSKDSRLNINGCCHTFRYYGLTSEERNTPEIKESVEYLEKTLRKWIPSLSSFSNFCDGKNGKRIRCQTHWSCSFQGVSYFDLPTNKKFYSIVDVKNNIVDDHKNLSLEEAENILTALCNENADVYLKKQQES